MKKTRAKQQQYFHTRGPEARLTVSQLLSHPTDAFAPLTPIELQSIRRSATFKCLADGSDTARLNSLWEHALSGTQKKETVGNTDQSDRVPFVVCASLLEKATNLGGLTLTCEAFNGELLTVPNLEVKKDPIYRENSRGSEESQPLLQVPESDVRSFLKQQQQQGYTVIALEQSAGSISLEKYTFPERCVFLLGKEKEGVPGDLLNLVDQCIEIPQFGLIRSLNVHVSAAILTWEYIRQRMLAGLCAN